MENERKDMNIGERIKERRLALGLTLNDLSAKAGVSRQTIFRYESGEIKNIPSDKIELIARALETTPSYLMGWEDNGTQSDVPYYLDEETAEIAQEVYDRPELKILFDASRKASKEDIQFVVEMIDRMAKKERGED